MRNLNFLRKSERKSVGTTLALTVGSPSAHRRYSALKHLAFMLLFLLGSLNVWGYTITFSTGSGDGTSASTSTACSTIVSDGASYLSGNLVTATKVYYSGDYGLKLGASSNAGTIKMNLASSVTPTSIVVRAKLYNPSKATTLKVNGSATQSITSSFSDLTFNITSSTSYIQLESSKYCWIESITVNTGSSNPSVSVSPASWDFGTVHASAEASKVFSVSGSNLTAGNLTLTVPDGFSVDPSSIAVDGTLAATNVTVSKNTSTEDNYAGNLSITGGGLASAKTVGLTMTVDADPAPTGTFELFSGDLTEGDYVFVYATRNNAMKASQTANANRLDYAVVTPSENKIVNPDASLVWHVAPISETAYWTIYSADAEKHIGSTNSNNQAKLLSGDLTDNMKWTVTSNAGKFDFSNVARVAASGNPYLRNNDDGTNHYGFACYANGTGGALSLYKKQVAGQPKAPTFSVPGGNYESAQSVKLSCETQGATIYYTTNGDAPTSSSTQYDGTAIAVDHTMTIKAIAIKNEISSTVASATYTIIVWQTVADVWDDIVVGGPKNAHVYGYVSQTEVGGYDNNFYISDNGSTEGNQLYAYRMNMNSFSVAVGDKVKLAGDLTNYQGTKEFEYANSGATQGLVVALEAKGALQSVAVSGTPVKTEYASGENFDPAGLKVLGTYANGFVGEITEGITWGNDLTDGKVTESTTVHVTATVSEVASPAYDVAVTVAAKTLESIAVGTASYTIYTGEILPKPVVTATFSEGDPEDVSAFAVYDSESVFDTEVIDDPDPQTITVSYTFGGETKTATYTVSVKDYANADDAPYTVTEALHIITAAIGNTESAREIVVAGTVSAEKVSNYKNRYKISDGVNELLVYNGKGFNEEAFTDNNYPKVGDVMVVKGNVINFNNNTPEFASGKSYPLSQIRPATIAIENVTSFEVGATDLTENDLDITTASDGDITFVSGDETKATIVADVAIHAVAPGTVTITANLAATENVAALNYAATFTTFDVTVVAPAMKYAILFDGNGADGGSDPEAIENKAAGAEVTLPANTWTKTGFTFTGWKVFNNSTSEEVEVVAGAFEMPASEVTLQAQWAALPIWATTYSSNITVGTDIVKFSDELEAPEYAAKKAGTGSAYGSTTVTVPVSTSKLHFHAVCYGADTYAVTLKVKKGDNVLGTFNINKDTGAKGSSPFILANTPYEQYYSVTLADITEPTTITFEAESGSENGKRFIIFGVNQEGGLVPVLDHIEIAGDLTTKSGYKAGDAIDMDGLTVSATYTLGGTPQTPVDITEDVALEWSYDPLVEGQENVTITATYKGQTDDIEITLDEPVASADPVIYVQPSLNVNFGTVAKDASVDAKTITVTLQNVAAATATLGGTNPEAFNIDKTALVNGDVITISVVSTATLGNYSATITITDNEGLAPQKVVNLSLNVEDVETPVSTTSEWIAATEIVNGMQVLIVGERNEKIYAVGAQTSNNRTAVEGSLSEGVFTPGENTMAFTVVAQEGDTYALQASNGKYLYAAGSGSGKNYLRSQDEVDDNAKWTLSVSSATANGTNTNNKLQLNNSSDIFSCYSSTQKAIQFYVPKPAPAPEYETVRSGLEINRYYTVCLPKKVTAIKGASFWTLNNKSQDGATAYLEEETNNLPFAAGKPFIIQATAEKLEVVYEGAATEDAGTNGALHGTLVYMDAAALAAAGSDVYMLFSNELRPVGENNHLDANRAYVLLSELNAVAEAPQSAPGKRVRAMPMQPQVATGFEAAEANEAPRKVLINGEFFIIRGEKMYDAKGQLVK